MTLPINNISFRSINIELGYSPTATISLNDFGPRYISGRTTNQSTISMSDLQGQTYIFFLP